MITPIGFEDLKRLNSNSSTKLKTQDDLKLQTLFRATIADLRADERQEVKFDEHDVEPPDVTDNEIIEEIDIDDTTVFHEEDVDLLITILNRSMDLDVD